MSVGDGVDDGHRSGQGEFQFLTRVSTCQPRFAGMHARTQAQRTNHRRTHRLVAVVTDAHFDVFIEIDALNRFEKAMHEVLARLFAVADDVDSGIFLNLDGEQSCVVLGGGELFALEAPWRPELVGLGKPSRLGQAACNRRWK